MRVLSIVGARPQFVKLAVICHAIDALADHSAIRHSIVHTGQHYDAEMSDVFFRDLAIPAPDYHLGVGSGGHGEQTGEMLKKLEPVLQAEAPDWVLLYGDTNSTLAGAVAASKLHLRLAHIEAGLRSFNRRMPEEINRVVADHLSDLLLCPTGAAVENLCREGLGNRARLCGDVMLDAAVHYRRVAEERGGELAEAWPSGSFALATLHRAENTDDTERLGTILGALNRIARDVCPVLLPLHPRARKAIASAGFKLDAIHILKPVSYLEMLLLESRARLILTDSGGVQKEAYFAGVPCITLRDETEWVETLDNGCNVLTGADEAAIVHAASNGRSVGPWRDLYGDGHATTAVVKMLLDGAPALSGL